jgi:uncharacterized protein (TIGR03085 family)
MTTPHPSFAHQERAALADLLLATGPDAPTNCTGWTTADLAAHLVTRERRLDSSPGIVFSALAPWTERIRRGARDKHPYPELVALFRDGPPTLSFWSIPGVDSAFNFSEFFIHHEDVRRAQPGWAARELPEAVEGALWKQLGAAAKFGLRKTPFGVRLATPDGRVAQVRAGDPVVTLTGLPSELTLYCSGRQSVAVVEAIGDPAAVAALGEASLGV